MKKTVIYSTYIILLVCSVVYVHHYQSTLLTRHFEKVIQRYQNPLKYKNQIIDYDKLIDKKYDPEKAYFYRVQLADVFRLAKDYDTAARFIHSALAKGSLDMELTKVIILTAYESGNRELLVLIPDQHYEDITYKVQMDIVNGQMEASTLILEDVLNREVNEIVYGWLRALELYVKIKNDTRTENEYGKHAMVLERLLDQSKRVYNYCDIDALNSYTILHILNSLMVSPVCQSDPIQKEKWMGYKKDIIQRLKSIETDNRMDWYLDMQ